MKKILIPILLAAVAAGACQREPVIEQENGLTVTIQAGMPEPTRTFIEAAPAGWLPYWNNGDVLGVMVDDAYDKPISFTNTAEDGRTGTFTGTLTDIEDGSHTLTAWYPKEFKAGRTESVMKYELGEQTLPSLTSFDPSQDLLIGLPTAFTVSGGEVSVDQMRFRRIFAVVKVTLTDASTLLANQLVNSVSLTAGATLTGKANVDLLDGEISRWENASQTVKGVYPNGFNMDGQNSVYLLVNPVTLPSGSSLTLEVETNHPEYQISKTVKLSEDIELAANKVTTLRFSLSDANVIDLNNTDVFTWDFSSAEWQSALAEQAPSAGEGQAVAEWSVNYGGLSYTSVKSGRWSEDGYIQPGGAGSASDRVFAFTAAADGLLKVTVSNTGSTAATDRFVTVSSGGREVSKVGATPNTEPVVLSFNVKEGDVKVYPTGNALRFYKLEYIKGAGHPEISFEQPSQLSYDAVNGSFAVSVANPVQGVSLSAAAEPNSWITGVQATDSMVSFTCTANDTAAPRSATITLSYEGADDVVVTINQGYNNGGSKETHHWNFSEFTDARMEEITGLKADAKATAGKTWDFGDGLTMVTNASSKWNKGTINEVDYKWVATGGKYGSSQKYFSFTTKSIGTVTVLYASGKNDTPRSLSVNAGGSVKTDSENVSSGTKDLKTVTFTSVAAGTVLLYSTVDNILIFSIDFEEE